jgi:hypothetical protein
VALFTKAKAMERFVTVKCRTKNLLASFASRALSIFVIGGVVVMSDGEYTIIRGDDENTFTDKDKFEQTVQFLESEGEEFETVTPTEPDGGTEVVDAEPVQESTGEPAAPESLSKNPIQFLQNVNTEFVNTIKGKQAVSKQGFRFIQREFEITTRSEVVQWSEDPLGCVVWARAELPSGYAAEAHGEGYQFESDVSDNEFVRYADTRAKNRALSDLTSAGALAVSELRGGESE